MRLRAEKRVPVRVLDHPEVLEGSSWTWVPYYPVFGRRYRCNGLVPGPSLGGACSRDDDVRSLVLWPTPRSRRPRRRPRSTFDTN